MGSDSHGYSPQLSVADKVISAYMHHTLMQGPVFVMLLLNRSMYVAPWHFICMQIFIPL